MDTIVILSDHLKPCHHAVRSLKELFPDCDILILNKKAMESGCGAIQSSLKQISRQLKFEQSDN